MNKTIIAFAAGVITGVVAAHLYSNYRERKEMDEKYQAALDALDEVGDDYILDAEVSEHEEAPEEIVEEDTADDVVDIQPETEVKKKYNFATPIPGEDDIHLVSPDDIGVIKEYDWQTITIFSDGVIFHDERKEIMSYEELISLVGHKAMDAIHIEGTRVVYVVNNKLQTYFDVIVEDEPMEPMDDDE